MFRFQKIGNQWGGKWVYAMNKSIYGLKQSGRNWNRLLHDHLVSHNFTQSKVDPCLYTCSNDDVIIVILIWVDDILIAGPSADLIANVKSDLCSKFKMTDFGQLSLFLGIQFSFENGEVLMNQASYMERVLQKFGMENSKPCKTPCEHKLRLTANEGQPVDVNRYRQLIGCLIYAMTCTRPDLSWVITKLSQYLNNPSAEHHTCAKHVLRYLNGTKDQGLCFRKSGSDLSIKGFADADWGGTDGDRKSTSGFCFKLNDSSAMSWKSKRQNTIALSSCEAEYMSLAMAVQEGLYLTQLMRDLDPRVNYESFSLNGDNQGALSLAKNPGGHKRSKHIDIKYHFIRDAVNEGKVILSYVPSECNEADVFTKPLGRQLFERFVSSIFGNV